MVTIESTGMSMKIKRAIRKTCWEGFFLFPTLPKGKIKANGDRGDEKRSRRKCVWKKLGGDKKKK